MNEELYKKHRPQSFKQLVGQDKALRPLIELGRKGRTPHALLLTGPSGCGKTTVARILRKRLKCSDHDFAELNTADFRGIDMVRDIRTRMNLSPIGGKSRVWLVDECHKLTPDAQHAFLKMLEDTPKHVYFILATTDPQKLLPTIRTRCTQVDLKPLNRKDMEQLLTTVWEKEGVRGIVDVMEKIIELAEGSPRKALVLLNQVIGLEGEEEQLDALAASTGQDKAVQLARLLIKPNVRWPEVAKMLKSLRAVEEDPEGLRLLVLAYCNSVLLGGGGLAKRAFCIMDCFSENFYSSKWSGLSMACYEAVVGPSD